MGLIYLICIPSGKKYIGQHKHNKIAKRKKSHRKFYEKYLKARVILELNKKINPDKKFEKYPKGYCSALYNAIIKYGWKKCVWVILENNIPLKLLNNIEDKYIIELNTLHPSGYNLILNKKCSELTKNRMKSNKNRVNNNNIYKYRTNHKELEGLPKFVTYFKTGSKRGYRITNHPNCKSKHFTDPNVSVKELKQRTLDFLKYLENNKHKTIQEKKCELGIPKGIYEQKPGKFSVEFIYKKKSYSKYFTQTPREKALKLAIEWMNITKKQLKNKTYNETPKKHYKSSTERKLPVCVYERKNGYIIKKRHNKKVYTKSFTNSKNTKYENLQLAINYLNNLKIKIKEEGSETK